MDGENLWPRPTDKMNGSPDPGNRIHYEKEKAPAKGEIEES